MTHRDLHQLTAGTARTRLLDPAMEARARNLQQFDPSPAVDSLLERLRALALGFPPSSQREVLVALIDGAIESNILEGGEERLICGVADELVTHLRTAETSGVRRSLGARSIANRLRGPLALIASPAGAPAGELIGACRIVGELVTAIPPSQLLSRAVAHELGQQKFTTLQSFAAHKSGAACGGHTGAVARSSEDSAHGEE